MYLGASFSLESSGRRRLVIDIGGGSTELIIGRGYQAERMDSLYMGCVSMSRRFFANGRITAERLEHARAAASLELEPIVSRYQSTGWEEVVGTSGTIRAVDDLSRSLGIKRDWVSAESFEQIERWMIRRGHVEKLDQLPEQRRAVFPGGFAILSAIFSSLGLERLDWASGALREGVLYDLNGRLHDMDSRDQGVEALVSRFSLDRDQSARLRRCCLSLYEQVATDWDLDQVIYRKLLGWASELHEIGTVISFNQNHKHGMYIIENTDIDGFSRQQQRVLALLVRSHRQKFPGHLFEKLPKASRKPVTHAAILLRLAFAFSRGRSDARIPLSQLTVDKSRLVLTLPMGWMRDHPLTMMDLEAEVNYLGQAGFTLEVSPR